MSEKLTPAQLKIIVKALKINRPVLSHRVVGNRVELHLLGGSKAVFSDVGLFDDPRPNLDNMSLKNLRALSTVLGIPGRGQLNKADLIAALYDLDPDVLVNALALI